MADQPKRPKLTPEEEAQAKAAGMSREQYAGLKNVVTYEDWQKLQKRLRSART